MVEEHQVLARQASFLQSAVQRLEGQAKQDPTEELVKRLSETYYQFQSITHQMQAKGSYVNYAEMRLVSEIDHLHEVSGFILDCYLKSLTRVASRPAARSYAERIREAANRA